jgi:hypothetical protein
MGKNQHESIGSRASFRDLRALLLLKCRSRKEQSCCGTRAACRLDTPRALPFKTPARVSDSASVVIDLTYIVNDYRTCKLEKQTMVSTISLYAFAQKVSGRSSYHRTGGLA